MSKKNSDSESEFPGLYGSEASYRSDSEYGDSSGERSKKELLKSRKKERNKDKGYAALEGDSSPEDMDSSESRNVSKAKKAKSFKFLHKKDDKDKDERKDDKRRKEKRKEEKKREKEDKKRMKKDKKKKADATDAECLAVFGVPLPVAMQRNPSHDGIHLPAIVRQCIDMVEAKGLQCEDIYRLGGLKSKANSVRRALHCGQPVDLHTLHPHVVAAVLKQFLKELPEPILTRELMAHFEDVSLIPNPLSRAESLRQLIDQLPTPNKLLLQYMLKHMVNVIKKEKENKMSVQNVCIILSPITQISHRVLNVMFLSQEHLLKDVVIHTYIPPLNAQEDTSGSVEDLTTADSICEEILRQESLLAFLHSAVASGSVSYRHEEQLWEAQRIVTLLKRKLKLTRPKQSESAVEPSQELSCEQAKVEERQPIPVLPKPTSAKLERAKANVVEHAQVHRTLLPTITKEMSVEDSRERQGLIHEQLLAMNHALTKRLQKQRNDVAKLRQQIREMQTLYAYRTHSYDSSESDPSDSEAESDNEQDIAKLIHTCTQSQAGLKVANQKISEKIQGERERIIELRVALRQAPPPLPTEAF